MEFQDLSTDEVLALQKIHGKNILYADSQQNIWKKITEIIREPMFLILSGVAIIYFITGSLYEGELMILALILVTAIDLFQEVRSTNALLSLRKYTQPRIKVIRNKQEMEINSEELVPGDIIVLAEGELVPADAIILQQNDLSIDEAILTGESVAVLKNVKDKILQGTTLTSGRGIACITATGNNTTLAQLGKSIEGIEKTKSPLQIQVNDFIRKMALAGITAFLIVFIANYATTQNLLASLLFGLTMAMSLIPEEIPVAFSTFMAVGAYRMSQIGILVKQAITVESLGSASVICLDKTGTITENKMKLAAIYDFRKNQIIESEAFNQYPDLHVLEYAMWASELSPFDPMEKALHEAYQQNVSLNIRNDYELIYEYSLSGKPPMMTHIYQGIDKKIIAGKGAVERIITVCNLTPAQETEILKITKSLAKRGFRVLGIAKGNLLTDTFPEKQEEIGWEFLGLAAMYDPPKKEVTQVFEQFYKAGLQVKMITGDYAETALAIANESGLRNNGNVLTGNEIVLLNQKELQKAVTVTDIFARMFPEAKHKIIEAIKANGEIVAMTGDGVNDGIALKAAHIGVAMGNHGTDIARNSASLIITDDNLNKIVLAIANGRKIYSNLKKAIRYIISIHIPIILTVLIPLLLNWKFRNIFSPVHIIFLEMIMGPTCSIFFENEPVEKSVLMEKPRKITSNLFSFSELSVSILQGLMITAGILGIYYFGINMGYTENGVRTLAFNTLIISNILLTLTNRSFQYTIVKTISYKNDLLKWVLLASVAFILIFNFVFPIRQLFQLSYLNSVELVSCTLVAIISVGWFEIYKAARK
jgi:Ca2+-transporting ATPase